MIDGLEPVTGQASPEDALRILDKASAPAASLPVQDTPPAVDAKPKGKGGFPKGGKRGPGGKKVVEGATPDPVTKVYDGTDPANFGGPPVTAQPVKTGAARMADQSLVAACKPHLKNCVLVITAVLARITRKPDMKATDEEAELIAEMCAPVLVLHLPDIAEATPEAAAAGAVLNYAIPRLGLFTANTGGIPTSVAVVEKPVTPPASSSAAVPEPTFVPLMQTGG